MRLIAGFNEPSSGSIKIDGQDVTRVGADKRPTNMVFQSYAIFPHLNVFDNVAFGLRKKKLSKSEIKTRVEEALTQVELVGLGERQGDELSGGQRQRVALARALVMRPKVLLLDEPLSALDKKLRENMQFELRRLQKSVGITFIMVTHDQYEAMTMSDRIGVMFDGKLSQVATPDELYKSPANKDIAGFVGGMNFLDATKVDGGFQTDAFGVLKPDENPYCSTDGIERHLGIRPEQIEIKRKKIENYENVSQAIVEDVAFYGESIHYRVRINGLAEPFQISVPNYFHKRDHEIGDSVWIGFEHESVIDLGSK